MEPYGNYPFHLILARGVNYDSLRGLVGISWNRRLASGSHNWSYVFAAEIDSIYLSASFVKQSIYNQVSIHELLHQIGNAFSDNEHSYHTGLDSGKCALHEPDHFINDEFRTLTSIWKICDRHITGLRELNEQPFVARYPSASSLNSEKKCKYQVEMSLAKYEYKQYEPVVAKFAVINKDSKPMKIYNLFNPDLHETSIMIYDNLGNKWSTNKFPAVLDVVTVNPNYVINPRDTLILSIPINDWGEKYEFFEFQRLHEITQKPSIRRIQKSCWTIITNILINIQILFTCSIIGSCSTILIS